MWCVASAPIVPLAHDLDAALGTQLSEHLPFISASCPRHSSLPHSPLGLHPRFFRTPPTPLPTTPLPSRAPLAFLPHTAHVAPTLRGQSPRLPAPAPRPAPQHATPSAPPSQRWGPSSENTKKRAPFLGERCSFWVLSGRKRPVILMFQKPQPKKTERTSCAKRMRMNMARG